MSRLTSLLAQIFVVTVLCIGHVQIVANPVAIDTKSKVQKEKEKQQSERPSSARPEHRAPVPAKRQTEEERREERQAGERLRRERLAEQKAERARNESREEGRQSRNAQPKEPEAAKNEKSKAPTESDRRQSSQSGKSSHEPSSRKGQDGRQIYSDIFETDTLVKMSPAQLSRLYQYTPEKLAEIERAGKTQEVKRYVLEGTGKPPSAGQGEEANSKAQATSRISPSSTTPATVDRGGSPQSRQEHSVAPSRPVPITPDTSGRYGNSVPVQKALTSEPDKAWVGTLNGPQLAGLRKYTGEQLQEIKQTGKWDELKRQVESGQAVSKAGFQSAQQKTANSTPPIGAALAPQAKDYLSINAGSLTKHQILAISMMNLGGDNRPAEAKPAADSNGTITLTKSELEQMALISAGIRENAEKGKLGEYLVRAKYEIGKKAQIIVDGERFIPDGILSDTLSEVKNTADQPMTNQLRAYLKYAEAKAMRFHLYVHPSTRIVGKELSELIASGRIVLRYIPVPELAGVVRTVGNPYLGAAALLLAPKELSE